MMTNSQKIKRLSISLLMLALTACVGDNGDLEKFIHEAKMKPAKPIEPIPQLAPLPVFKYPENDLRRSPFKPADIRKRTDAYAPDKNRRKQPLEAFPLDALRFVGTLKQGQEVWALIKQPDEQIFRLKAGNYMGQNYGRVISIKEDVIQLEETLQNSGVWEKKNTILHLDTGTVK